MKGFLNKFMRVNRNLSVIKKETFEVLFRQTLDRATFALGQKPFRSQRNLNVAVFDAFMVAIAKNPNASDQQIISAYGSLMADPQFSKATKDATSDDDVVALRLNLATTGICNAT